MVTIPPKKRRRPLAITIVVWVLVISAFANILIGGFGVFLGFLISQNYEEVIIFSADDPDLLTEDGTLIVEGAYNIITGVVQLGIAIGFWRQKQWAWVAAISWQALKLLIEIATPFGSPDKVPTMVFSIILIFLLNQSDVRRAFNIRRSENVTSSAKPLHILDVN